jgi:hypothetical protein
MPLSNVAFAGNYGRQSLELHHQAEPMYLPPLTLMVWPVM